MFIGIRSIGGGGLKTLFILFFQTFLLFLCSLPFTSFPYPSSLREDWWCWGISWGNVGNVLQSISYLMGLHSPEENNNAHTLPAQLDSSPMYWCLKSQLWGDSTQGTGQGLGDQWSIPFHSWKNIPSGNYLVFPAKHELVWQPDKLITPVHLIPHAWLITITRPRT